MHLLYPLIAIAGESIGKVIDKLNFNKNKIKSRQLIFLIFATMFIVIFLFILITDKPFPQLSLESLVLIFFMIVISFLQNFFDFKGLSSKNLSLREPINNFKSIFAGFLAYLLFPSEREIKYLIAIAIGVFVLYWGNTDKKFKITFDRGTLYLFLGMICSAILVSVYKIGLESISPEYLFIFRVVGILLLLNIFSRPNIKILNNKQVAFGIIAGMIYCIGFLARLYSIEYLGLNFTIMILLLGPAFTYFLSFIALKEEIKSKQIITSIILIVIILFFN